MQYCHLSVLVHNQAAKYGERVALKYRDYATASWVSVTWNAFSSIVRFVMQTQYLGSADFPGW